MNKCAIFVITKDRSMQYEACIRSIKNNFPEAPIYTLAKYSNQESSNRYFQVYQEHKLIYNTEENNFRPDFIKLLNQISEKYEYVSGFTDDSIVFEKLDLDLPTLLSPFKNPNLFTISLRLGLNTTVQDIDNPNNSLQIPLEFDSNYPEFFIWDWQKQPLDKNTGYGISLDGHIYRTKELLALTKTIDFANLREWEGRLIGLVRGNANVPNLMGCLTYSHCVNLPYNFTQYPFHETVGPYGVSIKQLNELFDQNYRFDLEQMFTDVKPRGSHWYVKPVFKRI